MTEMIRIPAFLLPFGITLIGAAVTYGGTQARANSLEVDVARLDVDIRELSVESLENHKGVALNEQAIQTISDALDRQHETQKETAAVMESKLQTLIEVMINKD